LYYVAAVAGASEPNLYKVSLTGGAPVLLDSAEDANLNATGDKLVYSKIPVGATTEIFTRGVNAGDTATRLTNNDFEDEFAQWSKDGTKIVFSSSPAGSLHIYTMNADGSNVTQVSNTANADDLSPTFNGTGSQVAFYSLGNTQDVPTSLLRLN